MSQEQEDRRNQLSLFGLQVVSKNGSIAASSSRYGKQSIHLTLHVTEASEDATKNAQARSLSEVHEQLLKRVKLF